MTSGVYRIRNIVNGKCYIGESKNVELRWQYHIIRLRKRIHKSKSLQRDFNAWVNAAYKQPTQMPFVFELLMRCDESKLEQYEKIFIIALKPKYNTQRFVGDKSVPKHIITKIREQFDDGKNGEVIQTVTEPDAMSLVIYINGGAMKAATQKQRAAIENAIKVLQDAGIESVKVTDMKWLNNGEPMAVITMQGTDIFARAESEDDD